MPRSSAAWVLPKCLQSGRPWLKRNSCARDHRRRTCTGNPLLHTALEKLALADPELARKIGKDPRLKRLSGRQLELLVEETVFGLSQERHLGLSVAHGLLQLAGRQDMPVLKHYARMVRQYAGRGPAGAKVVADHLPAILQLGDHSFAALFEKALTAAGVQGVHTLNDYMCPASRLLPGDPAAARAYLDLLTSALARPLAYHRNLHLSQLIPDLCLKLAQYTGPAAIDQLKRLLAVDIRWADAFAEGLEKGLGLLSLQRLTKFIDTGLDKYTGRTGPGRQYFSLNTQFSRDIYDNLQTCVALSRISRQLNRYIRARTGQPVTVRPLSQLPSALQDVDPGVCSSHAHIFLPDRLDRPTKHENLCLYKALAGIESGCVEFGTFDFELSAAIQCCGWHRKPAVQPPDVSDLEAFLARFDCPALAADLFTIFEQGRIRRKLAETYPGLAQKHFPLLQREARRLAQAGACSHPLAWLYRRIALGMRETAADSDLPTPEGTSLATLAAELENDPPGNRVETSAKWTARAYTSAAAQLPTQSAYRPLRVPFGRRIPPALVGVAADDPLDQQAAAIQRRLAQTNIHLFRSDIRRLLTGNGDTPALTQLGDLIRQSHPQNGMEIADIARLLDRPRAASLPPDPGTADHVYWYAEWDNPSGDYLLRHTRVLENPGAGDTCDFYQQVLLRHPGLLHDIRRGFELLRPQGLVRLRNWYEGDALDYRRLIAYAVDRRMRITPSQRLYIKHLKHERDVAVLLLTDISRSTTSRLPDSECTVLDVEKESMVLFCEALEKCGDAFSVATFYSRGRFSVAYLRIKSFEEALNETVRQRIGVVTARGRTRIGAAVRHATGHLAHHPAKLHLLILLSDGFPNDTDYKGEYAVRDAAKAVSEARAAGIHVHGITVNLSNAAPIDDIYGRGGHSLISDIRELPRKLPAIYRHLTR